MSGSISRSPARGGGIIRNPVILRLIGVRIAANLLLLLAISLLVFLGTELLPGNVAEIVLGQGATPEAVAGLQRGDAPRSARRAALPASGSATWSAGISAIRWSTAIPSLP